MGHLDRYFLVALLFCVIFTTGYFGQHFGYTVHGIPMGTAAYNQQNEDWQSASYGLDVVFAYWEAHFQSNAFVQTIAYIFAMGSFSIDNTPGWMAGIFDLIIFLAMVLAFTMIRGGSD